MTDNLQYNFKLPIGDSSGDGHKKCEWFTIKSNVSLAKEISSGVNRGEPYDTKVEQRLIDDEGIYVRFRNYGRFIYNLDNG